MSPSADILLLGFYLLRSIAIRINHFHKPVFGQVESYEVHALGLWFMMAMSHSPRDLFLFVLRMNI